MRLFVACALLLSPLACSNNRSVVERELGEMRQKIAILQSERQRLEQRLELLEQRAKAASTAHPQGRLTASADESEASRRGSTAEPEGDSWQRPALQVVRLTPSAPSAGLSVSEPDTHERYLIYGTGDELKVRELPGAPAAPGTARAPVEVPRESRP